MGPIYSFEDFVDMLRRRVVLMAKVVFLGTLVSLWFAARQTHEYESAEVIQIVQPKIADDLAKSTVEGSSARRLQLIQQRLMARGTVLEIVEKLDLYSDMPQLKPSQLVALMRESVRIEGVAAAREGFSDDGTISVLTIIARMPTAEQAQQVASEFARRTIELSVNSRIELARETLTFFAEQEAALASNLAALEDELTAFRNANDLTLPGTAEFRRAELATINGGLLDIAREQIEVRRAADHVSATERPATAKRMLEGFQEQLDTLKAQNDLLLQHKSELEASLETSPEAERQLDDFERQQQQLQNALDAITARRTEAEVGFRLETRHQSERLTVIEPAALPDYPITGGRKRLAIMGVLVSVMVALAVAYVQELRQPVLRSAAQMQRETGLAPVVSIPVLDTRRKRRLSDLWRGRFKSGADA
ncbi:DUF874 domain-containing protein [Parasedimentitalea huanghaiensis]|uniref:DUF874 domain-containing protein n=1 Tax=Parasedimentitalea huanghaiensis TaxID=2682100 RepID=A0A6L6WE39_9RHOB|nr:DUF874 domain-containing protein [Zongyanglinia huanghaiensis]MVO15974.1 DUF874 domain-containing protein [Zongyanglinia huanghaiensis]